MTFSSISAMGCGSTGITTIPAGRISWSTPPITTTWPCSDVLMIQLRLQDIACALGHNVQVNFTKEGPLDVECRFSHVLVFSICDRQDPGRLHASDKACEALRTVAAGLAPVGQDAKADNLRRILSEHQSEELATGLTDALLYPGVSGLELVTWHEVFERGEQVQLKCDVTFDAGGQTILWRHDLYEGELPSDFVVLSLDPCEHTYLIAKMSIAGEPILSAKTATYVRRECIKHSFDTSRQAWNQVEWDLEQRDLMPTQFRWAQWPGLHCSQWRGDTYDLAEKKGVTLPARLARTTVAPLPGSNKYVQRKKHIEYEKTVNALTLLRICVIRLNQYECGDPRRIKAFNQTLICYYQCVLKVLKFDELLQPQSWWPPAMGVDYEVTCSKKFSYQEIQSFIGTPYSEATHNPDWRCKKLLEHLSQFMCTSVITCTRSRRSLRTRSKRTRCRPPPTCSSSATPVARGSYLVYPPAEEDPVEQDPVERDSRSLLRHRPRQCRRKLQGRCSRPRLQPKVLSSVGGVYLPYSLVSLRRSLRSLACHARMTMGTAAARTKEHPLWTGACRVSSWCALAR